MIEISVKKEVYEGENHCSYVNRIDKCSFLGSGPVCQLFRVELKKHEDFFTAYKCDECKAACLIATEEAGA